MTNDRSWNEMVWDTVVLIPRGKVASYGQIAALLGHPRRARQVGYALHATPKGLDIPWQRVINAKGEISFPEHSDHYHIQRALLEADGITFKPNGRIDWKKYGWDGLEA
jgi:methylated-DNA-protein-cysteine methyltransferase-like protein